MSIKHIMSRKGMCWQEGTIRKKEECKDKIELTGDKAQEVLGFGGCFNELGWEALQLVSKDVRTEFLDELFGADACNFNYGRIPIGANDFSLGWYSCDDVDGDYELAHFNIDRDRKYTIPFIREAQKRREDFSLFASPWSPPEWMKTKKVYNFGRLRMEEPILKAYAQYFVKFIQEYAKENIPITQVHVQNEPMADQKFPSCLWYGEDMRDFIGKYLGPALEEAGLDTELWLGTINGPFVDFMMPGYSAPFNEFYDQFAATILSDEKAYSCITGVGLQWGGKHVMEQIAASYPEKRYMNTESECGDGKNTWEHMEYIFNQMWYYFRHGAEKYTYWNMALQDGGVSSWGWEQNSLCTVNPETKELKLQPEFYLMKHLSHFVKPGAHYLKVKGHLTTNTMAFENPDGSVVLIVGSNMDRDREFTFEHAEKGFSATIEAHSIHTFVID